MIKGKKPANKLTNRQPNLNHLDPALFLYSMLPTGKTPEEIRKTFNIKNDFTPSEEEQVQKENDWYKEK